MIKFSTLCLLFGSMAIQAEPRSGGDTAGRQAQAMMQKMAAEKNELQKQNGELTTKSPNWRRGSRHSNPKLSSAAVSSTQRNATTKACVRGGA